ncbi:MAG: TRM11 family SAM-dependent methyltransferase, partial [Candidatus Bathyarchaeia archaeon]
KSRVDLLKPEIEFLGAASKRIFALGVRVRRRLIENFQQRTPRKKLFFHPASLHPKIARCLVNLSRPAPNSAILDPFCGTGTILIEAGLMGFEALGGDLLIKMAKGSKTNLNYFEVSKSHIALWDALHLPLKDTGRIVTNPPYGRSTSTRGLNPYVLVDSFLRAVTCGETPRTIVVALPFTTRTRDELDRNGLKIHERHLVYVHKSLTREILVLSQW